MLDREDDWRLQGQNQLHAEVLHFAPYKPQRRGSEHDCCQFCWKRFKSKPQHNFLHEGFVTRDRRWICENCYEDFKDIFDWRLQS